MSELDSIIQSANVFERFVWLSSQYAPFFFAVFFILFVPILGQTYFRRFILTRTKSAEERKVAVKLYSFYWMSGVIFGLFLVMTAIIWYMYLQIAYVFPSTKENIARAIEESQRTWIKEHVYVVNVVNVKPDDVIMVPDQNIPDELDAFAHYGYGFNPFMIKVVLLSKNRPIRELGTVQLWYMSRAVWEAMKNNQRGGVPLVLPICPSVRNQELDPAKLAADQKVISECIGS